jgi:hypothetical protein
MESLNTISSERGSINVLCKNPTEPCGHCEHNKAAHQSGLGQCIGYHCRCSRFMKQTAQTRQIKAMRQGLSVVIEMLEEWPTDDEKNRSIRVGSPTLEEKTNMLAQLRKALATQ